jgi:hypothetical protein
MSCLAFVLAATADASPRRVAPSEAIGNPVLAGESVVYAGTGEQREVEVRRVAPDGSAVVVAQLGRAALGDRPTIALAASNSHLAASRLMLPRTDSFRYTELLQAGPLAGPLSVLDFHCPGEQNNVPPHDAAQPTAVDGSRLAYVHETCASGLPERRVVIRDLATGNESGGMPTSGVGVALAGRYVAFRDPADKDALQVFDLERATVAYSVRAPRLDAFDVQDDGKLAVAQYERGCDDGVTWYSPADAAPHLLTPKCDAQTPLAMEKDRIAYVTERGVRVHEVPGGARTVRVRIDAAERNGVLGFDGERIAFATRGCSSDTGAVWTVGVSETDTSMPKAPRCRADWGTGPVRVDAGSRAVLRLSCPAGCRGTVLLERRGRNYGSADFELKRRGIQRLRVPLRRVGRLFGRQRIVALRLQTYLDTASEDDPFEFSERVTLRR